MGWEEETRKGREKNGVMKEIGVGMVKRFVSDHIREKWKMIISFLQSSLHSLNVVAS